MEAFGTLLRIVSLWTVRWTAVALTLAAVLVAAPPASAHERRKVGSYTMVVGWADEPTFTGFKNAVQAILTGPDGKPVTDLGDTLKVEVIFGNEKRGPLALEPAFGPSYGRPGDYHAQLIPTRPGNYTFHFIGEIKGEQVDASFTSSDDTFSPVGDSGDVEFPVKDPSRAELSGLVERVGTRLEAAQSTATSGRVLSIVALIMGAAALIVAFTGRYRR